VNWRRNIVVGLKYVTSFTQADCLCILSNIQVVTVSLSLLLVWDLETGKCERELQHDTVSDFSSDLISHAELTLVLILPESH
jgi:hypothetical protein